MKKFLNIAMTLAMSLCAHRAVADVSIKLTVLAGGTSFSYDCLGASTGPDKPIWGVGIDENYNFFHGYGGPYCTQALPPPPLTFYDETTSCEEQPGTLPVCVIAGAQGTFFCSQHYYNGNVLCPVSRCANFPVGCAAGSENCNKTYTQPFDAIDAFGNGAHTSQVKILVEISGSCPTPYPSEFPTKLPTNAPTVPTTLSPTLQPTFHPTDKPTIPSTWICQSNWYGALDGCDCECGAPDPDCEVAGQYLFRCPNGVCAQGHCLPNAPPANWVCSSAFYNTQDGCDCQYCGAYDPDCLIPTQHIYGCSGTSQVAVGCDIATNTCVFGQNTNKLRTNVAKKVAETFPTSKDDKKP